MNSSMTLAIPWFCSQSGPNRSYARRMRALLVLALTAACGKDAPPPAPAAPPAPPAGPLLSTVAQPVPAGPYIVTYSCGAIFRDQIDLETKTRTTVDNEHSMAPVVSNVSEAMIAMVGDSVSHVLAGGPYRAEPGRCALRIDAKSGGGVAVFSIEKSAHQEKDAVSDLVRVFVP